MELISLDSEQLLARAAHWLNDPLNRQWLDFGDGAPSAASLRAMSYDRSHLLRAFTSDQGEPIGLVGLSGVNRDYRSALLWALLGERRHQRNGYVSRAAAAMLTLGFTQLRLECISAWTVACNPASLRILKKLNFRPIGRQRDCHYIDGQPHDRLLFELLAVDHARGNDGNQFRTHR